jgi:hypothetical protein
MPSAGGSCQEMGPAVDFAVHAPTPLHRTSGPRKARRPETPFPATHPRSVETAVTYFALPDS